MGMDPTRGNDFAAERGFSGHERHCSMQQSTRPHEPARVHPVQRVQSARMFPRHVTFKDTMLLYFQYGWSELDYTFARRGPWMYLAANRRRFERRILDFDSNFGYIFTDIHRDHMLSLIDEFNLDALIDDMNRLALN